MKADGADRRSDRVAPRGQPMPQRLPLDLVSMLICGSCQYSKPACRAAAASLGNAVRTAVLRRGRSIYSPHDHHLRLVSLTACAADRLRPVSDLGWTAPTCPAVISALWGSHGVGAERQATRQSSGELFSGAGKCASHFMKQKGNCCIN